MNNLKQWLDRQDIPYRGTAEWSLMFEGNFPNGLYVSKDYEASVRRYNKQNKGFRIEYRCNYETLYLYPAGGIER
jgi:hypothetical protein